MTNDSGGLIGSSSPSARATALADRLRRSCPAGAQAYGCRLQLTDGPGTGVVDADGRMLPEGGELADLATNVGLAPDELKRMPVGAGALAGSHLCVVEERRQSWRMVLFVVVPPATGDDISTALQNARGVLANELELELLRGRLQACESWAEMGELAGPVMHEFNNLLNTLVLRLALIEPDLPPHLVSDVRYFHQQIRSTAFLVEQYQRYRRGSRTMIACGSRVDVCRLLCDVIEEVNQAVAQHHSDAERRAAAERPICHTPPLAEQSFLIEADEQELRSLFVFLLRVALFGSRPLAGPIEVTLGQSSSSEVNELSLAIVMPAGTPLPTDYFAPRPSEDGLCGLELPACRSIVGRLGGRIRATSPREGRVCLTVDLPLLSEPNRG